MNQLLSAAMADVRKRVRGTIYVTALTGDFYVLDVGVVTAGGTGYTSDFACAFTGGGEVIAASATAIVDGGKVVRIEVAAHGRYTSAPTIDLSAGDGTGAAATAFMAPETLDAVVTDLDDMEVGAWRALVQIGALLMPYDLVAGTDAESSPLVIRPFDYAGSTNEKVWKLRGLYVNSLQIADGTDVVLGTTTGTKIGTVGGAAGEKLGFWAATPIVQPVLATGAGATADNIISVLQTLGLCRQS